MMSFGVEEFPPVTNQGERPDGSMDYVVISGISCRLPQSENIAEFKKHLMRGDDLLTENKRWESGSHGLPPNAGLIDDIDKFDAAFFGVPPKLANNMDPQLRMMLELTYEALVDSGISPPTIRGSNTAVYVGCGVSEAWEALSSQSSHVTGYSPLGCTTSMFANRISFSFDLRGPSYGLRNGCASGLLALDRAVTSIRQGDCDTAIVVGCNLCLKPSSSVQLSEMSLLSPDGKCRCFDVEGGGMGRSEGIVAMYLQRKALAKRVYCTVIHSKSATFTTENNNINYPTFEEEIKFLQETYSEARIDPSHIAYVETSSTCNKMSNALEMNAISNVVGRNRKKQLLVGSVKSNIGHTESASGLASVSKIIITMEEGVIPPTLHYDSPQIQDGQLQVVTEKTRLGGEYCSVNSFGLGGANVHTILKSHSDKTNKYHFANEKRRLCIYSARTKEGLESIFQLIKSHPRDSYLHYLLNETSGPLNKLLPYRGYTVVNSSGHVEEIQKTELDGTRPLWFIYSGMGTQWPKMGRQMMQMDMFRTSIMKCDRALRPHGIHLYDMIMEGDNSVLDSVTNSFVTIAAIQVALTDMLFSMNLKPDGIVGHSVGELGCGYADGCQTPEETVLAAYWRGRCIEEANLPPGGMAAVGLTWEEAKLKCPEGVVAACHNAKGTVTVSGPADKVAEFVKELKTKQVFAREVNSAGVAFHSSAMQNVAPRLKEEMNKILKPKLRTSKWISSSIPESKWDTELAKTASADYLVNNLVSPVLFQEALKHIPSNAIVIEVAPHGLLQAVLKRSLDSSCSLASLMKRDHSCNPDFFFTNLGKCYIHGASFNPLGIFPSVDYPVPRGTAMISPAIKWDRSQSWYVPETDQFLSGNTNNQLETRFEFDASRNDHDKFLVGHKINGKILFPATGYIVMAWKALARLHGKLFDRMPVVMENIKIHRATIIPPAGVLIFDVTMIPVLGEFEICEGDNLVASGHISAPSVMPLNREGVQHPASPSKKKELPLEPAEVYRELRLRGYDYEGEFRGIGKAIHRGERGELLWNNNWVTFLDTMMQMLLVSQPELGFCLPTGLASLKIDPEKHTSSLKWNDPLVVPVQVDLYSDTVTAGCVEMNGLKLTTTQQKPNQQKVVLEKSIFVPHIEAGCQDLCPDQLQEYHGVCSALAGNGILRIVGMEGMDLPSFNAFKQIAKTLKPVKFVENVDKFSKLPNNGLLLILNSLFSMSVENFRHNSTSILEAYRTKLGHDRLMTNLLQPRSLNPCLDLVLENNTTGSVRVLEFSSSEVDITDKVIQHYNTRPEYVSYVKVNGTATNKSTNGSPDVKHIQWDIEENAPENLMDFDLLVANNYLHRQRNISKCLKTMSKCLKDDGFLVVHEVTSNHHLHLAVEGLSSELPVVAETRSVACYSNEEKWQEFFEKENFETILKKSDGLLNTMFLLRKKSTNEVGRQTVMKISQNITDSVEALKKNLKEVTTKPQGENLWLLSHDNLSGLIGMVNCLRKEPGGEKIRCVLDISKSGNELSLSDELVQRDLVVNFVRDGVWGSLRHLPISMEHKLIKKSHGFVDISRKGDLSTLQWNDLNPVEGTDIVHCKVHYVSLGTKDLMYALGRLPANHMYCLGSEFSGITNDGRKVMGVVDKQALATDVYVDKTSLIDIPDDWTLAEAATVTSPFGLAYYSLLMKGKITADSNLLIADASSTLGQAALAITSNMKCKVFALVNSKENLQYLKLKYPALQYIYILEDGEQFEGEILRCTKGKGVDVVLTATNGNLHQQLSTVLRSGGQYLDLSSDYDFSILDKDSLHENIAYHHIKTDHFDSVEMKEVMGYIQDGIRNKIIQPLDFTCYQHTQIQHAFNKLQDPHNLKSVLVQIREDDSKPITIDTESKLFTPEKTYILVGGLGGVGLELADWISRNGATKLVLTSRSGVKTGYQERKLRLLRGNKIEVNVSTAQVTSEDGCKALLDEAEKLGPVGGIFNLAMVLEDGLFENQTQESFRRVCEPKVNGTRNLDKWTRQYCKDSLDWFIVFSSITSGLGNMGQTNYGYGNAVMERICEQRKEDGLPGLAIQWGAIGDVGVVADKMGGNNREVGGTYPQRMSSVLDTLKAVMLQDHAVVMSYVPAEKAAKDVDEDQERTLTPLESVMKVIEITDVTSVNHSTSLIDLGLDSLMTTEIRQNLDRQFGIVLPVSDIRKMTIKQLKDYSKEADGPKKRDTEQTNTAEVMSIGEYIRIPAEEIIPLTEIDNDKDPVFIIDLLPGPSDRFMPLADDFDHSVYIIRCTEDSPVYSVQSLAGHYIQEIDSIHPDKPFHLIGVSLGGRVALEMALQKQRLGKDHGVKSLLLVEHPLPLIEKNLKKLKNGVERDMEVLKSLLKALNVDVALTGSCRDEVVAHVQSVIWDSSNQQLERGDIYGMIDLFLRQIEMILSYTPDGQYEGQAVIVSSEKTDDLKAQQYFTERLQHEVLDLSPGELTPENFSALRKLLQNNM